MSCGNDLGRQSYISLCNQQNFECVRLETFTHTSIIFDVLCKHKVMLEVNLVQAEQRQNKIILRLRWKRFLVIFMCFLLQLKHNHIFLSYVDRVSTYLDTLSGHFLSSAHIVSMS